MITTQSPTVRQFMRERPGLLARNVERSRLKIDPYRPAYKVLDDGAWAGERCFVVGGGPSLEGFDFERLQGQGRIIAINRAFEWMPFADICFFMDGSNNTFYGHVKNGRLEPETLQKWEKFQGLKIYLNIVGRRLEDVYSVRSLGRVGVSNSITKGLYHGNNSGIGAIGLAMCLKANPIYLLGFDCKFNGGKSHFHGGYPMKMPESIFKQFPRDFSRLNRLIMKTKFKVINLNPQSGIRCFPFKTIDEALR